MLRDKMTEIAIKTAMEDLTISPGRNGRTPFSIADDNPIPRVVEFMERNSNWLEEGEVGTTNPQAIQLTPKINIINPDPKTMIKNPKMEAKKSIKGTILPFIGLNLQLDGIHKYLNPDNSNKKPENAAAIGNPTMKPPDAPSSNFHPLT
jgi:hypothetical protein